MYLCVTGILYFFTISFVYDELIKVKIWINFSHGGSMSESAWTWFENWGSVKMKSLLCNLLAVLTHLDLLIICFAIFIFIFYAYLVSRSIMQTGLVGLPRTD